jgi:hypothetical protein
MLTSTEIKIPSELETLSKQDIKSRFEQQKKEFGSGWAKKYKIDFRRKIDTIRHDYGEFLTRYYAEFKREIQKLPQSIQAESESKGQIRRILMPDERPTLKDKEFVI